MEMSKPVIKISPFGTQRWILNDKLHREDGPALIYLNGHKEWYLNGQSESLLKKYLISCPKKSKKR
jgi:hypothetical protein